MFFPLQQQLSLCQNRRTVVPEFLENALSKSADAHGFTGERKDHYVYGGMNNLGAMHGNKETAKGREMDRKHRADQLRKVKAGKAKRGKS